MVPQRDPYLLAEVREAFGRVTYSHKTHEKQADISLRKHRWQQTALVALTAVSSGTFLAVVVGLLDNDSLASLATASVALLVTWISLATQRFRLQEDSNSHRDTASILRDIRDSYISLIAELMSCDISAAAARQRRSELQEATTQAYATAPRTSDKAYRRAQEALKHNEEMTFTPAELDLLLPEALRLGKDTEQP